MTKHVIPIDRDEVLGRFRKLERKVEELASKVNSLDKESKPDMARIMKDALFSLIRIETEDSGVYGGVTLRDKSNTRAWLIYTERPAAFSYEDVRSIAEGYASKEERDTIEALRDENEMLRAENARLEAEKQASMDHAAAALETAKELEAESAKLREALRRSMLFAEAVSTGRDDGDDYAASDLARCLRSLLEGGE